jgi:hypothetical protein
MPTYIDSPPDGTELEALAGDVVYEYVMLQNTAMWCLTTREAAAKAPTGRERAERLMQADAFLESFLTHARNLHHFFACNLRLDDQSLRVGDDVFALDYIDDWRPAGKALQHLQTSIRSINKRVHHVTAYRQRVPKSTDSGSIGDIVNAADSVWRDFTSRVSSESLHWFAVPA